MQHCATAHKKFGRTSCWLVSVRNRYSIRSMAAGVLVAVVGPEVAEDMEAQAAPVAQVEPVEREEVPEEVKEEQEERAEQAEGRVRAVDEVVVAAGAQPAARMQIITTIR